LSFDVDATLRRLKPEKRTGALTRRPDADLLFAEKAPAAGAPLLLDTTVYIDTLQKRLPEAVKALLRVRPLNHSAIAAAELAHAFGRLNPGHPDSAPTLQAIGDVIRNMPPHRLAGPSIQATVEAGIVSGTIARLHGLAPVDRQPLLNDAMLFLQAMENGSVLLTRNIADMDLIQQLVPAGRVLFYRQAT
jgi:predicted nucleic acid-binding protein